MLHVTWIFFMLSNMEMQKIQLVIEFVNCTFVLAVKEYHQHWITTYHIWCEHQHLPKRWHFCICNTMFCVDIEILMQSTCVFVKWQSVATLALGSRPRQRGCKDAGQEEAREPRQKGRKGADQEEARESHHIFPGMEESVREWTLTLPRQLPLWEMESWWTPETS